MIFRLAYVFLFLLLLGIGAPSLAHAKTQRIAILVGNNIGMTNEAPLRYAEKEAEALYRLLLDIGGVPSSNAYLLIGKNANQLRATLKAVTRRIADIRQGGDAQLIFYYSGHASERDLHLGSSAMSLHSLKRALKDANADTTIVIVDSCKSGSITRAKGFKAAKAFQIHLDATSVTKGQVFITSSAASEVSIEDEGLSGSVFSHFLISGLRGDADADKDGRVDIDELYKYSYHRTVSWSSETSAEQHPNFDYDLRGAGSLILSWPKKSDTRLIIGPNSPGTFLIASKHERRIVAEVNLKRGETKTIALTGQRYIIKQRLANGYRVGEVNLTWGGVKTLDTSKMRFVPYDPVLHKGLLPTSERNTAALAMRMRNGVIGGNSYLAGGAFSLHRRLGTRLQLGGTISVSRGETNAQELSLRTWGIAGEVEISYLMDIEHLQLAVGGFAGPALFWQSIPAQDARGSLGVSGGPVGTLRWMVADPLLVSLSVRAGLDYQKRRSNYSLATMAAADLALGIRF